MTPAQIINILVISGSLPVSIGLIYAVCQLLIQKRTPKYQIEFLEKFSRMAAQRVLYEHEGSINKKMLVIGFMSELYKQRKIKLPSAQEMDIAAASALFEANGFQSIEA